MRTTAVVLARLIESPALVGAIRALSPPAFGALVRKVGVEDAGELLALATTEQLVAAFDEDLFVAARPGEREVLDARRFVTWLEVLLEAGDRVAAARLAEMDEDFLVQVIGELAIVLDQEELMMRMSVDDDDVQLADKALASSHTETIDGYTLVALAPEGWDAVMAVIAALDRDHRALLARVLDRCAAAVGTVYLDDLAAFAGVLQGGEMTADDVDAARESRRAAAGYVEPRAAAAFLNLPPGPMRDPLTRAYFRDLGPAAAASTEIPEDILAVLDAADGRALPAPMSPVVAALATLPDALHAARLAELAYLANVVVAGGRDAHGDRYTPHAASAEVLAMIERAASLRGVSIERALSEANADILFREGRAAKPAR